MRKIKILIVDDARECRQLVRSCLQGLGDFVFLEAENGELGFQIFLNHSPEIVFTDINMPVMSGAEMIRKIWQYSSTTKIIVITGDKDQTVKLGLKAPILPKPFKAEDIRRALSGSMHF